MSLVKLNFTSEKLHRKLASLCGFCRLFVPVGSIIEQGGLFYKKDGVISKMFKIYVL